ncbi:MAG: HAD hydrolase-like protein [bacterium]|nr:HAD hydrolase-like protein [bacterium]
MSEKLILFDIDGTLVNTAGAGRHAMERAFSVVFGIERVSAQTRGVRFAGMTDRRIIEALATAVGVDGNWDGDGIAALRREYLAGLRERMARHETRGAVLPGAPQLVEHLASKPGVHLGLLTGNLEQGARIKLEPFDLNRYFPDGGFGCEHADRSEVARVARDKAALRTGIEFDGQDVVVVGDTDMDVACARAHGFRAVALACGFGTREELERSAPDALLEDLADLPRAVEALGI